MKTIICCLLMLLSGPVSAFAAGPAETMTIFVVQPTRQRPILERDAVLMANAITAARPGDHLQAVTTTGAEIFSWKLEGQQSSNPLQVKSARDRAITEVKQFFLQQFRRPTKSTDNDIAGAIALALDRFNYAPPYGRLLLVLLDNGLQRDRTVSFMGCYPADSWIVHELSPFASIKPNATAARLDVVIVPQPSDYVNSYHTSRVERWYRLLFQYRQAHLIGFTSDHQSAAQLIERGGPPSPKSSSAVDLNGPLTLIRVGGLVTTEEP